MNTENGTSSDSNKDCIYSQQCSQRVYTLRVTRNFLQFLGIILALSYIIFFLCHGGSLFLCSSPKPIVCTATQTTAIEEGRNEPPKWQFWRRKKIVTAIIPAPPADDELPQQHDLQLHPICPSADNVLKQMRSMLPLLDNVILASDISVAASTTCPSDDETALSPVTQNNDTNEKVKGFFHREVELFKSFYSEPMTKTKKRSSSSSKHNQQGHAGDIWSPDHLVLIQRLALEVRKELNDGQFEKRMKAVSWGGEKDIEWWSLRRGEVEANLLLGSYLKIMKWPENLRTTFPFKPCTNTCSSTYALIHTLSFREAFKPWLITPSVKKENTKGFIYHAGHTPPDGPSLVYFRPGVSTYTDNESYLRAMISTLEFAVTDCLRRTKGEMGQFTVVMDANKFKLSSVPKLSQIKRLFLILQDHFPNRLSHLLLVNLSTTASILMKMLLPFVTEEVRKKLHIVPNDEKGRREMLNLWIGEESVPDWLVGNESKGGWRFDASEYYSDKVMGTEVEAKRYLEIMHYHA